MKSDSPNLNPQSNFCSVDTTPWWKRFIRSRFFKWHPPTPGLPEWAKDGIIINTHTNFSWPDRMRILLTGNVSVRTFTACENPPGRLETQSSVVVPMENF